MVAKKLSNRSDIVLSNLVAKAVDETTKELYEELLRIIDKKIYSSDPEWYTRTYQFRDSFEMGEVKQFPNYVEQEIFQNLSTMVWNNVMFQHGNCYEPLQGYELSNILNYGSSNTAFGFPPREATNFWDEFEQYASKNVGRIFKRKLKMGGVSIEVY